MKKGLFLIASFLLLSSGYGIAQLTKEQQKERQELAKQTKKQLNEKASKAARSEAKRLKKEGWKVAPGALPLEKQLDRSYLMQYEITSDGVPQYIMSEGMSTAGNYDAGKMQALELAKQNLAGQIQTEVTELIDNTVANTQLEQGEATSLTKSVLASKHLISQRIGRVTPIVEAYRDINGNNREVLVRIAYNMDTAKKIARDAIREELEKEGSSLHNQLDQLLGW